MAKSIEEQLQDIEEKKNQLEARKKAILAREKEKEKKERTHRLIQIGAIFESEYGEVKDLEKFKNWVKAIHTKKDQSNEK